MNTKINGLLYDPDNNNGGYNLPIFDNDTMLNGFTFRDFIDVYIANNGRANVTPLKLKAELCEYLNMRVLDCKENLDLCINGIIRDIENT